MVDKKKINFTFVVLVVHQIHNLNKQLRLYLFQAPSDSLYKLCNILNTFLFLFLVLESFERYSQRIPLSDVLTLIRNWVSLLSHT